MYLAIIGFAMVAVIVALLLKGKMSPIVVLITIPTIAALLAGFGISDIGKFIVDGVKTTQNNAVLFIFSCLTSWWASWSKRLATMSSPSPW